MLPSPASLNAIRRGRDALERCRRAGACAEGVHGAACPVARAARAERSWGAIGLLVMAAACAAAGLALPL